MVGAAIDPSARVSELSVADRQLVEIAKALALEPKVLVLDEPTESLTPVESDLLFEQVRAITAAGTAVVYISHRLPEVQRIADRITVLRDGETRGTVAAASVSEAEILRLIIGRAVDQAFPPKAELAPDAEPLVSVRGLSGPRFHDVSLDVRPGEIVGLAGVEGNGQREFLRALAGLLRASGSVTLAGRRVPLGDPGKVQRAGIVHLPGDRHAEGVLLPLSVRENVSLLALGDVARGGIVQRGREAELVAAQIQQLDVRTPGMETPISALSGGNQQKVLFARSLLARPVVLLADEPTRGVDANARLELYQVLRRAAQAGQAVIVVSSDVVELQGLCDRVLVFSRGQVVRTARGRRDHRGEHHRRGDHVRHAALGSGGARSCAPAVAPLRRGRLPPDGRAGGADRGPHDLHVGVERLLPLEDQLRQHAAARERARVHRARPADRDADGRDRPLGRPADGARRRRDVVLRRRGPERRADSCSASSR